MLKNLFKVALRNLLRERGYTSINLIGLAIGITCSLFLLLYILDELSYDRYHAQSSTTYRVVTHIQEPDNAFTWAIAQYVLAPELADNHAEVVNAVRFFGMSRDLFKVGDKEHYESDFKFTDSTVFRTFSYTFLAGDPATALNDPQTIVLTEKIARKYFGDPLSALDKSIHAARRNEDFKITGIIKDVPPNSHFKFDALMSRSSRDGSFGGWGNFGVSTYLQLRPDVRPDDFQKVLDAVVKEKVDPVFAQAGVKVRYELQKITDIHLHSKIQDEAEENGDIAYIYIFASVAAFMLLIACINYMNLATARSARRAKEVGLRKVMGSERMQLVLQFLTESVMVSVAALVVSIVMIYLLLPFFNTMANKQITIDALWQPTVVLSLLAIILLTGVLGGSYPAFYLSSFQPVTVLKGRLSSRGGHAAFRRVLVVLQFSLTIFMLISTWVVYDQLQYMHNKDLGFTRSQVVKLALSNPEMRRKSEVLAERLRQQPSVEAVGKGDNAPGEGIGKILMSVEDQEGKMVDRGVDLFGVDDKYLGALDMKIVKGRNFSRDNPSDTAHAVLVNESMVKRMNWSDPIGKRFEAGSGPNGFKSQVVGVVKDYNQQSLYGEIEPLMIFMQKDRECNLLLVRLQSGDLRAHMDEVSAAWKEIFPQYPFEYTFLDEDLDSQYKADQKRSQIFSVFSGLTILIACLGLLGLAAYSTEQRTHEVGIRKVIGASVGGLVMLMVREFLLLTTIAMVMAFPVSWYFTGRWLEKFAYRIELTGEWPTFVLSALLALAITFITVGFHVIRTATSNPVRVLREN